MASNQVKNGIVHIIGSFVLFFSTQLHAQQWQSSKVFYAPNGKLVYSMDSARNRIPDFSFAGYKNGETVLPDVNVRLTISPIAGDNTASIQKAIDSVGKFPVNGQGIRGALLLTAGRYHLFGTLNIKYSGVILRGVGEGSDSTNNTIIYARGDTPHQREVIIAGGGSTSKWNQKVSGVETNIISDTVAVGEKTFTVADASQFSVGDNIIINHPCTAKLLSAIDTGGTHWYEPGAEVGVDVPWSVNQIPIVYNRWITSIQGNVITVDVPVFNHLVRSLSQSTIYKYARTGLLTNIGLENLRIDIESLGGTDENHAWTALYLLQLEDSWVKNCTFTGFGHSGVMTNTATRITVQDCKALDPVSIITGERRYNFNAYTASQQILFKNCTASNGRHHFASNGTSYTSGVVFVDCTSQGAYTSSEGHRQWSTGFLYDNHNEMDGPRDDNRLLGIYNRGYYGTSHGWAMAHTVAWNCNVRSQGYLIVQQAPTAQNYAIGCFGIVTGKVPFAPFDEREGFIEGTNKANLNPRSLYYAQLQDRLGPAFVRDREIAPTQFQLFQNYPNPFNGSTVIKYDVKVPARITIEIDDVLGRRISVITDSIRQTGEYEIRWNAKKESSGIYYCKLTAQPIGEKLSPTILIQKMILAK